MVWFQFLYKCVLFTISYGWLLSKYLANHGITSRKIINEVIVPEWCCASIYHRRRCYLIFQQRVQFKATPASNWKLCFINLVANKYHVIHLYGQLCYINPKMKYHMNCTVMKRIFSSRWYCWITILNIHNFGKLRVKRMKTFTSIDQNLWRGQTWIIQAMIRDVQRIKVIATA